MGLDTTHDCWSGGYGRFNAFRREVAKTVGMDLDKMEGFSDLPGAIKWDSIEYDPLHELLNHSDCDGMIESGKCVPLAKRLQEITKFLPDEFKQKAIQFSEGLWAAAEAKEDVEFF